jgi:hypothetical protein
MNATELLAWHCSTGTLRCSSKTPIQPRFSDVSHPRIVLHQPRLTNIRVPSVARLVELRRIIKALYLIPTFKELKVET